MTSSDHVLGLAREALAQHRAAARSPGTGVDWHLADNARIREPLLAKALIEARRTLYTVRLHLREGGDNPLLYSHLCTLLAQEGVPIEQVTAAPTGVIELYLEAMGSDCDHHPDECPDDCPCLARRAEEELRALRASAERADRLEKFAQSFIDAAVRIKKEPPRCEYTGNADDMADNAYDRAAWFSAERARAALGGKS